MTGTLIYKVWDGIIQRCENSKAPNYYLYGGRGIGMCPRWRESFETFLADMGLPPKGRYSIDRINNNGNYEPSNCRWATVQEQQNNRNNNVRITFKGRTQTLSQWCRELGLRFSAIENRINTLGWNPVDAITIPVRIHKH